MFSGEGTDVGGSEGVVVRVTPVESGSVTPYICVQGHTSLTWASPVKTVPIPTKCSALLRPVDLRRSFKYYGIWVNDAMIIMTTFMPMVIKSPSRVKIK